MNELPDYHLKAQKTPKDKALVVLSGGQDSVTCLLWALDKFSEVQAITFDYAQRHRVELICAKSVCQQVGVKQKVVDMSHISQVSLSALVGDGDVSAAHALHPELPASYVPNRNAMMLTAAHAWAQAIGYGNIVTGVCQTDYSGYPDCHDEFIQEMSNALDLGSNSKIIIQAPMMYLNKAQTFDLANDLGGLDFVIENSHTCYEGDRRVRHPWGYGCGECPACKIRAAGYEKFLAKDFA